MNTVDRYIEAVQRNIFAAPVERERLESDLRAHIEDGLKRSKSEKDVLSKMGDPEDVAAAFMADVSFDYASFWERVFAFIGDLGLCFTICLPFLIPFVFFFGKGGSASETAGPLFVILAVFVGLAFTGAFLLYFPLLESRFGKTFGKHVMRLRVIKESGAAISLGEGFLRRLSFYFKFLWLDALFVPFTAKRQRAFDIIARTVVVREPHLSRGLPNYALCAAMMFPAILFAGAVSFFAA